MEWRPLCLSTMEAKVWWLWTMPHHQWWDGAMCNGVTTLWNGGQVMVAVDHATPSMVGWCNVKWCEHTMQRRQLCLSTMEARVWWQWTMPHHQWCDGTMSNGVSTPCKMMVQCEMV